MPTYSHKKEVPFRDILKSTRVLFRLAWQTDPLTVILFYLTAIIGGLVSLGTSYVLKLLIDQLQAGQLEALNTTPIIIAFTLGVFYLVSLVQSLFFHTFHFNYLDYILRNQLQNALTKRYVQKVSELDIAHFENAKTQDLLSQVHGTMKWQIPDIMRLLGYVTTEVFAYLSAVIVLIPFGWWIPLLVTLITIPRLYLRSKYGALQWSIWGAGAPEIRKLYYYDGLFANHVSIREMKIAQSGPALIEKYGRIQDYLFGLNKAVLKRYLKVSIIPPIIELGVIFLIAYSFLDDVLASSITVGTFTLLVSMLSQVNSAAGRASGNFGSLYEMGLHLFNYAQVMDIQPVIVHESDPIPLSTDKPPRIEFKNVSFSYPDGPRVLHNISFSIEPGESIALVGHNGAGKSTLINLLCRFYDVTEGEILINGTNIKSIDIKSWYKALGTLFQTYVQYHFNVRENIAFEEPTNATLESLQSAAEKSGAHTFIQKMPHGYEQQLGKEFEGGLELSGGQWQKLAIARAFYAQAPVLILDEPTSAIDAEAEYEIFNNLEETYQNKSLILVSHRFSTVRNADKIYVIDEGRIIEHGSHSDLLTANGRYATMFLAQAEGYQ